jgi:RNA polymerase sigma-70 factor (ECF subfamily)
MWIMPMSDLWRVGKRRAFRGTREGREEAIYSYLPLEGTEAGSPLSTVVDALALSSPGQPMDPSHTAAEFGTTHWSLVYGARGDRSGLEHLLRRYWSPVYAFIRKQGYGGHDASDLTQEFLSRVVIGRDLVGKADPARGRFRSFLKGALRNFLIDQHRTGKFSKGGAVPNAPAALPEAGGGIGEFSKEQSREFDREWAATLVQLTLRRTEDEARSEGLGAHWEAFNINVLGPTLRRTEPLGLEILAAQIGAADAAQASNMVQTMKRRFRRTLREVVAETVATEAEVEDELAELRGYMGGG